MKRILSALIAAASVVALTLGVAGTANAEKEQAIQPGLNELFLNEVSVRGTGPQAAFQEYLEIAYVGYQPLTLTEDLPVLATFGVGQTPQVLAIIPAGTVFKRGKVFTIAHPKFTACVPDLLFQIDPSQEISPLFGIGLGAEPLIATESVATTQSPFLRGTPAPVAPAWASLRRVAFTGDNSMDYAVAPKTPCRPDQIPAFR